MVEGRRLVSLERGRLQEVFVGIVNLCLVCGSGDTNPHE